MKFFRMVLIWQLWLVCLGFCIMAHATEQEHQESMLSGFSAGLGGALITNEYKDMHGSSTLLPLLGYEGEYAYLRGVAAGIHFFRIDWLELNAQISYLPQHFYADDSDDWAIRRLDDRYSTLMGGFNGRILSDYGVLNATFSTDLLGYNNGILIEASYAFPVKLGIVDLLPAIGFQWADANYDQYYYGVDHSEARKSGLSYYEPRDSFSPYAQLGATVNFDDHWSAMGSARITFLGEEIHESPMVQQSEKYAFTLGAMYRF